MNYISCNMRDFLHNTKDKRILCFGGGSYFKVMCLDMAEAYPDIEIAGIIDNDKSKWGTIINAANFTAEVFSLEKAVSEHDFSDTVIVITAAQLYAVKEQLESIDELRNADVYSYFDLKKKNAVPIEKLCKNTNEPLIPKIIHYCWFGGCEMPVRLQKCIDSWKKYCPDYEIKRWDESNYNVAEIPFLKEAYAMKKWAFISDYARFDIAYKEGGIYFDTDVELMKSPDILRYNRGFIGTEITGGINSGSGFGAVKNHPVLQKIKGWYENTSESRITTNVGIETELFYNIGYKINGQLQVVDDMAIYPYYVLSHKTLENGELLENDTTISVHYFCGLWR